MQLRVALTPVPPAKDESTACERIKVEFIAQHGYWRPWIDTLPQACPNYVEQYARYAGYPARIGPLSERLVELIYIALDSSSSHRYAPGLQTHLSALWKPVSGRASFGALGHACDSTRAVQSMDPGYAQVLAHFIKTVRSAGGLSPAERTLIQLALHSCFTAFHAQAVRAMVTEGLGQSWRCRN